MRAEKYLFLGFTSLFISITTSCNQNRSAGSSDEFTSGTYNFVFDGSIAPVLDQEMYVFKSIFPEAKPNVSYQPENKILDMILNNKARFAVMARDLKPDEVKLLSNRNLPPEIGKVAVDAIAVIVGKNSKDTAMSVSQVKDLFQSNTKTVKNLVFDDPNSSILNYLKNKFTLNQSKQKNIYALKNSIEVIKYVATHQDAVGFISYTWLTEPDAEYADAAKNINVVAIKDEKSKKSTQTYFKPNQSTLALMQYPLSRFVYVVDCTGKVGLGTGFSSFLQSERGQKIVLRSGLLPETMPTREISIKKEL